MSYTKNDSSRAGSGEDSDSEEEIVIAPRPKGRPPKNAGDAGKGKKIPEKKSYRCDRCNFSSFSKAKFTKHAKSAHSGTVVQCDHCEFKTPYKWNLDRHYKNHLGGGALCCHICNFSCDIKQSLTVHLQNHHTNVPEEIIESVKRQQIPPRNQSANNPLLNNNNNNNSTTPTNTVSPSQDDDPDSLENGEKKVPILRISRSLTGLSLGEESKDDEGVATGNTTGNDCTSSSLSGDEKQSRKCDYCEFEVSGVDASLMKKHLISQHGIHKKHHHHHHAHHNSTKRPRSPSLSSSPENQAPTVSASPTVPVTPVPLPPKKNTSKGSTSPRPGQSASSCSNSPAIHRSQSPLKASEAVSNACGGGAFDLAVGPSSDEDRFHHQSTVLNLSQSHPLQISSEESAFTPVIGTDYTSQALSSLKKPKHRALAQFYQKIKPKFTEESATVPVAADESAVEIVKEDEDPDGQKNLNSSSKSNRCQHCRQRCKSSADLAAHLEKCLESSVTKKEQTEDVPMNGPTEGTNDGLIGFETAPGVGSIHNGKMEETEYEGYEGKDRSGESKASNEHTGEEEDEEYEDTPGNQKSGGGKAGGKSASTTSRKVYRCPENDCSFWATTASRFHVHIVGHYNLKPFECSECHYKSNWRWDVNKHIRLKTPKDPKHASAKTLLTHESGQRDYRRYDNYLVNMSLTHGTNAKAPECSTVANKRSKGSGNTVSSPKSSPDLPQQVSPSSKESPTHSPATTKRSPKYAKALAAAAVNSSASPKQDEVQTAFEYHGSNSSTGSRQHQDSNVSNGPVDLATSSAAKTQSSAGGSEGRSFVEARTMSGGEIYQQQNLSKHGGESPEGCDDEPSQGFDLTLKSSHHPGKLENVTIKPVDVPVAPTTVARSHPPTKKSRLKQLQQEQFEQQQILEETSAVLCTELTAGNKVQWQCIKCTFKHTNKELVSCHIRDAHKPKKGDPLSLLAHNHFVQVVSPEKASGESHLMSSATSGENGVGGRTATLSPAQKKELYQQMYHENGKVLSCKYCPYSTGLLYEMEIHADHHLTKSQSYFSCPHCSYSVAVKSELQEHLRLHGNSILPEIQNRLINSSSNISSSPDRISSTILSPTSCTEMGKDLKPKYHCVDCPYTTNDSSEFQYHRKCHEPHDFPFKCHRCSFNVSVKFHLIQHLGLHGIQIDDLDMPEPQSLYTAPPTQTSNGPVYEDVSNDYSPPAVQDEPLNLSVFANRKPVVIWENGVPIQGYRCNLCPDVFRDLNDLKEHELLCKHRGPLANDTVNGEVPCERQCESPPCEAINLSFKPAVASNVPMELTVKKSSHSKVKESLRRSIPGVAQQPQNLSIPAPSSSPSSVHSAELGGASGKGEKENLYLCDECPARFFFEKELQIHHTFHENKSTFQCPKCTYSARQKDPHLMSHMRVHGAAYQEKTKALLVKFPRAKVAATNPTSSSNTAANAAAVAAAAALSNAAASLLSGSFPFSPAAAAAAMLTAGGNFKPGELSPFGFPGEAAALETLRKNGLSIVCPKCPEKFYTTQAFQQHYEFHNPSGRTDHRCRFCDYCADSRKSLTLHELVHSTGGGSAAELEAAAFAGKFLSGTANSFNPVSMMAMVAHQDNPFAVGAVVPSMNNAPGITNGVTPAGGDPETIDKSSLPVPDEAYEGNPDFVYPTYMKNGRVKSKRYKCTKCPSAFEKKDQYHTHIGLHGSNQKYKCTVCDYAVTYYANYIQHLKKHENQGSNPSDLLSIGRKRPSEDDSCGMNLATKMAKYPENGDGRSSNGSAESTPPHSLSPENRLQNRTSPSLKCSLCPFQGLDHAILEGHLIHHQDNPNWLHVCNICTFRTSSKKSLKEHAKLHLVNSYHGQPQQPVQNGRHGSPSLSSSSNGNSLNLQGSNGGRYNEEESSNGSC